MLDAAQEDSECLTRLTFKSLLECTQQHFFLFRLLYEYMPRFCLPGRIKIMKMCSPAPAVIPLQNPNLFPHSYFNFQISIAHAIVDSNRQWP